MDQPALKPRHAVISGLDPGMTGLLRAALAECSCETLREEQCQQQRPDIVFCSDSPPALAGAMARWPGIPAVVASRLPDTDRWIDALEAGAADYCAAPFEPLHLRWLLEAHTAPRRGARAASAAA